MKFKEIKKAFADAYKNTIFYRIKKRYTIMRSLERATNQTDSFGMDERVSLLKATIELLEALDGIEIHGLNGLEFVPEKTFKDYVKKMEMISIVSLRPSIDIHFDIKTRDMYSWLDCGNTLWKSDIKMFIEAWRADIERSTLPITYCAKMTAERNRYHVSVINLLILKGRIVI